METTYQLKPNVTWHDGTVLHAEHFAFGWRVYSGRASSHAGAAPFRFIEGVQAPDARTFVIRWWQLYPGCRFHWRAAARFFTAAAPRPGGIVQTRSVRSVCGHPFWTREYVGLGPY